MCDLELENCLTRTSSRPEFETPDLFQKAPEALFGSFTTSGSGHGLRILSELVGRAYGVVSSEILIKDGYIGARLVEDSFVGWFHWPLSGA